MSDQINVEQTIYEKLAFDFNKELDRRLKEAIEHIEGCPVSDEEIRENGAVIVRDEVDNNPKTFKWKGKTIAKWDNSVQCEDGKLVKQFECFAPSKEAENE